MSTTTARIVDEPTLDERWWHHTTAKIHDLSVLAVGDITDWCERRSQEVGYPFGRSWTPRWNDEGEPIGPDVRLGPAAARLVDLVTEAMVAARESTFDRVTGGGTEGHTAAFTWRDIATSLAKECTFRDADPFNLPIGRPRQRITADVMDDDAIGGLLVWNKTRDDEHGELIMLTGQTADQERQVVDNAFWHVTCGAVYAASRVGMAYKRTADYKVTQDGETLLVWAIPNDSYIGR